MNEIERAELLQHLATKPGPVREWVHSGDELFIARTDAVCSKCKRATVYCVRRDVETGVSAFSLFVHVCPLDACGHIIVDGQDDDTNACQLCLCDEIAAQIERLAFVE